MIKFNNVSFSYGKKSVLENFNLEIADGERVCLFGSSGVGKTTLLRLIMGLEKQTKGDISGIENKKISTVFQEDRLLPFKTVFENISLFGGEENVKEILKSLNLHNISNFYPKNLSGGMARRVAIARVLNREADIYILDEPFNGIDRENIEIVADFINKKTMGKTVIIVTHSLYEAELLNTKIINM